MWTLLVVIDSPAFDLSLSIGHACEPVGIQAFIPQPAVKAFHIGVLYRLTWLNEVQPDAAFFAPGGQRTTAKLRAVIQHDRFRQASLLADPLEHATYPAARPAMYQLRGPGIPACNRPLRSTCELPFPCSRNR